MKNNLPKILEIIWLITSFLCIVAGIHQTIYEGFSKSYIFFLFSIVAFLIFLFRQKTRKLNQNNK